MKPNRSILRGLLAAMLLLTAVPAFASERVMVGENIYVGPDEELDAAVCVFCSIRIDGSVREAVAVFGSIEVKGEIERDTVAVFGGVRVAEDARIDGDTAVIGGDLEVDGEIGGDTVAVLGGMKLGPNARIGGDAVAVLGGVDRSGGSSVEGEIAEVGEGFRWVAISGAVILLLTAILFGLALAPLITFITVAILGEQRVVTIYDTLSRRGGMCFLIGIGVWLGSIIVPMALFWAVGTETIVSLAFVVVAAVGYTGIGLWVGRGFLKTRSVTTTAVSGSAIVGVLQFIPVLGWFVIFPVFGFLALGAATLSGFGTSVDWMLPRSEAEPVPRPTRTA